MRSSLMILTIAAIAASCSQGNLSSDLSSTTNRLIPCVSFTSEFDAGMQQTHLKVRNDCHDKLDFSQARIVFSGTSPREKPWGDLPKNFSWIDWQIENNGFSHQRDPAQTWANFVLEVGDSLELRFGSDGPALNSQLYLGAFSHTAVPAPVPVPSPSKNEKELVAYFPSWSAAWAGEGSQHQLANLPPYVTTVLLSFVLPETTYQSGQYSWANTGMNFSSDFEVVKDAIRVLKVKNPRAKVLLSIGGATYKKWHKVNVNSVAALVQDLGADGADLDYEPSSSEGVACYWGSGGNSCSSDLEFIDIIRRFRAALPRPYVLTTAAWSTGAFGTERYPTSRFANIISSNFGLYINPLKEAGHHFDAVYIMSYDAGGPSVYDPKVAFEAYRDLYKGPLMLGVEVPPESWGGHISTPHEAKERAQYTMDHGGQGLMIWSLYKPGALEFFQAACEALNLQGCHQPVL